MWYLITLLSGFSFAAADALTKQESRYTPATILARVREAYALPFLLPVLMFIPMPSLDIIFWIALVLCVIMDFVTTLLYMKALQIAPLSLTIPYMGLTPIFSLFIAMIMLGENVSVIGMAGIFLVSAGTYILQIDQAKFGWLAPFTAIFKNRGSLYMFIVSLCYAVTANIGKIAIQHSSPLFMAVTYFSLLALALTPWAWVKSGRSPARLFQHSGKKLLIGLMMAAMALTHFAAISMINVAYMISIKRLSILFAIVFGWIFFRETNMRERLAGGLTIIAGAALIALA